MGQTYTQQQRLDAVRLARSENVGPVTYRDLLAQFGSPSDALDALPDLARRGGRKRPIKIATERSVLQELTKTEALGARMLICGDADYPALLAQTDPPPPVLTFLGLPHLLQRPAIAMVGARSASAAGLRMAHDIARGLSEADYVIASGMARGIDTACHTSALSGGTIAVLAGGIDNIYPEENTPLYNELKERGAIISEMPLGTVPRGRHFPRRNRIISGLSLGTIVVEAAPRSGSLITARFALEQNRELMAVPGSPLDPRSKGCNRLIQQGAALVENAADVIDWLSGSAPPQLKEPEDLFTWSEPVHLPYDPAPSEREQVLSLLSPTPIAVDDLIRQSDLPARTVQIVLIELDLAGRLVREAGQRIALLPEPSAEPAELTR